MEPQRFFNWCGFFLSGCFEPGSDIGWLRRCETIWRSGWLFCYYDDKSMDILKQSFTARSGHCAECVPKLNCLPRCTIFRLPAIMNNRARFADNYQAVPLWRFVDLANQCRQPTVPDRP
jgi:hypothetical protein